MILLIADPPKIGTALLIKFGVKFADFVLEHKLQKRISHRWHIDYKKKSYDILKKYLKKTNLQKKVIHSYAK